MPRRRELVSCRLAQRSGRVGSSPVDLELLNFKGIAKSYQKLHPITITKQQQQQNIFWLSAILIRDSFIVML